MPRPVWRGSIAFGLVSVPVKLYTAVRDRSVRFHQLEQGTGSRIRYRRVSETTGEEVPREDIVRGYELGDGRYVTVTDDDLDAAAPARTRTIDIEDFVDLAAVDPVYFDSTYYLGPADPTANRAYALLHEAMRQSGRAAIGRFVLRSKERLVALRTIDGALALQTMHFHDEVEDPSIAEPPGAEDVSDRELAVAEQLIDSLATDWKPERYADTYRERVLETLEAKARGEQIVAPEPEAEPADVVDLVAALRASVERTKSQREGDHAGNGDAYASMTRDELYQQAQKAGIRGRSDMSKEQLANALRNQRASRSA